MKKNNFTYKWSKLFASKRYNSKDGVITLTPMEQQELLDDSSPLFDGARENKDLIGQGLDKN